MLQKFSRFIGRIVRCFNTDWFIALFVIYVFICLGYIIGLEYSLVARLG